MAVVAIDLDEAARAEELSEIGTAVERKPGEPRIVAHHVCLAAERERTSRAGQVFAQRDLAYGERHAVPRGAVARNVASGVERHARGPADARLHEGALEAYAAARERVEIARGDMRVAVTAEVIGAQLIAHDEQNVADGAHRRWHGH